MKQLILKHNKEKLISLTAKAIDGTLKASDFAALLDLLKDVKGWHLSNYLDNLLLGLNGNTLNSLAAGLIASKAQASDSDSFAMPGDIVAELLSAQAMQNGFDVRLDEEALESMPLDELVYNLKFMTFDKESTIMPNVILNHLHEVLKQSPHVFAQGYTADINCVFNWIKRNVLTTTILVKAKKAELSSDVLNSLRTTLDKRDLVSLVPHLHASLCKVITEMPDKTLLIQVSHLEGQPPAQPAAPYANTQELAIKAVHELYQTIFYATCTEYAKELVDIATQEKLLPTSVASFLFRSTSSAGLGSGAPAIINAILEDIQQKSQQKQVTLEQIKESLEAALTNVLFERTITKHLIHFDTIEDGAQNKRKLLLQIIDSIKVAKPRKEGIAYSISESLNVLQLEPLDINLEKEPRAESKESEDRPGEEVKEAHGQQRQLVADHEPLMPKDDLEVVHMMSYEGEIGAAAHMLSSLVEQVEEKSSPADLASRMKHVIMPHNKKVLENLTYKCLTGQLQDNDINAWHSFFIDLPKEKYSAYLEALLLRISDSNLNKLVRTLTLKQAKEARPGTLLVGANNVVKDLFLAEARRHGFKVRFGGHHEPTKSLPTTVPSITIQHFAEVFKQQPNIFRLHYGASDVHSLRKNIKDILLRPAALEALDEPHLAGDLQQSHRSNLRSYATNIGTTEIQPFDTNLEQIIVEGENGPQILVGPVSMNAAQLDVEEARQIAESAVNAFIKVATEFVATEYAEELVRLANEQGLLPTSKASSAASVLFSSSEWSSAPGLSRNAPYIIQAIHKSIKQGVMHYVSIDDISKALKDILLETLLELPLLLRNIAYADINRHGKRVILLELTTQLKNTVPQQDIKKAISTAFALTSQARLSDIKEVGDHPHVLEPSDGGSVIMEKVFAAPELPAASGIRKRDLVLKPLKAIGSATRSILGPCGQKKEDDDGEHRDAIFLDQGVEDDDARQQDAEQELLHAADGNEASYKDHEAEEGGEDDDPESSSETDSTAPTSSPITPTPAPTSAMVPTSYPTQVGTTTLTITWSNEQKAEPAIEQLQIAPALMLPAAPKLVSTEDSKPLHEASADHDITSWLGSWILWGNSKLDLFYKGIRDYGKPQSESLDLQYAPIMSTLDSTHTWVRTFGIALDTLKLAKDSNTTTVLIAATGWGHAIESFSETDLKTKWIAPVGMCYQWYQGDQDGAQKSAAMYLGRLAPAALMPIVPPIAVTIKGAFICYDTYQVLSELYEARSYIYKLGSDAYEACKFLGELGL